MIKAQPHWIVRRTLDPVQMVMDDLDYLKFRRTLVLATVEDQYCVHRTCISRFKGLDFFDVDGSRYSIIGVDGLDEAQQKGAQGFICCCGEVKDTPTAEHNFKYG